MVADRVQHGSSILLAGVSHRTTLHRADQRGSIPQVSAVADSPCIYHSPPVFRERTLTVIGLTGGIASGKSTLSTYAQERGAYVIDADLLGHRAYEPGTACFDSVVSEFGQDVVAEDGSIDRKVLGSKVFAEESSLKRLTDIVWPAIKEMARVEIENVKRREPNRTIVLEAAVLLEAGWHDFVDEVWVAVVDVETAITRTMKRDGVDRSAVQSRIDAQLSNEARIAAADVVFDNSGTEDDLLAELDRKFKDIEARSAA